MRLKPTNILKWWALLKQITIFEPLRRGSQKAMFLVILCTIIGGRFFSEKCSPNNPTEYFRSFWNSIRIPTGIVTQLLDFMGGIFIIHDNKNREYFFLWNKYSCCFSDHFILLYWQDWAGLYDFMSLINYLNESIIFKFNLKDLKYSSLPDKINY